MSEIKVGNLRLDWYIEWEGLECFLNALQAWKDIWAGELRAKEAFYGQLNGDSWACYESEQIEDNSEGADNSIEALYSYPYNIMVSAALVKRGGDTKSVSIDLSSMINNDGNLD